MAEEPVPPGTSDMVLVYLHKGTTEIEDRKDIASFFEDHRLEAPPRVGLRIPIW